MKLRKLNKMFGAAIVMIAALIVFQPPLWAASCCGGGSGTSLILPKFSKAMWDLSFDYEVYDGFWDIRGNWVADPPGSDLNQYRLNLGYAHRLAPRWQASVSLPYVWNRNRYANLQRDTSDIGDASVAVWYEAFDKIMCVWDVNSWEDLMPAVYWGAGLTLPTGTSPHDDVQDNFDITGRGAYRFDLSLLLDKTVYPWNATFSANYGRYLERSVNREYGTFVEPYDKHLGDRFNTSLSFGYTYFTDAMESLTTTLAYAYLKEDRARIDGAIDPTSGLRKESVALTVAWATADRDWVTKFSWSHAAKENGWGRNFPSTDIFTVGVSHVLR